MLNLKPRLSALLSKLCAVIIAWLGFGCSNGSDEPDVILCMYGSPNGSFEVKGQVTTEDGIPVEDAEIRVTTERFNSDFHSFAKTVTGTSGQFQADGRDYAEYKLKVVCIPGNPALEADSAVVDVKYARDKNDKSVFWYVGHTKATVDFKLKKKQSGE